MEALFSKKQNYLQFLKFVAPSIATMIFLSFSTTIDGFFVSRFVNSNALASINIVIPRICIIYGVSVMLGTGSGALVGIKLGEKDKYDANKPFSFITLILLIILLVLTAAFLLFLKPLSIGLGANEQLLPCAMPYGFLTVLMTIPMMFKLYFEYYARVDGSPKVTLIMSTLGLVLTLAQKYRKIKEKKV